MTAIFNCYGSSTPAAKSEAGEASKPEELGFCARNKTALIVASVVLALLLAAFGTNHFGIGTNMYVPQALGGLGAATIAGFAVKKCIDGRKTEEASSSKKSEKEGAATTATANPPAK